MTQLWFLKLYHWNSNTYSRWVFNSPSRESAEAYARTIIGGGERIAALSMLRDLPFNLPEGEITEEVS
jgi:hypothetical protein